MIQIINLCKKYDNPVLDNINLKIEDGSIFGLVGINGAGKSTLLKTMCGILKAEKGYCLYDGNDVFENNLVKKEIFFLPDEPFYSRGTTVKNLPELYKSFYEIDIEAYKKYIAQFKLPEKKSLYAFSKGMKRQAFCALALAIKPKYLFLDEAFDGLDPLARLTLKKEMLKVQEENNMTVVITSHSLRELEDICDTYGILDGMQIASTGDISDSETKYHKYRVAFGEQMKNEDFSNMEYVTLSIEKRIVSIVSTKEYDEFIKDIENLNPLIIDEIDINFEEMFMIEVEARGYSA